MITSVDASVIISTYNSPQWLELVLHGYFIQEFRGKFEILIADDGSTSETASVIENLSAISPWPIRHIWQSDDGFQKCRILNKAIAASKGKLLLFTDGDCVPQSNMLQIHASRCRKGSFLTGGYLKLSQSLSRGVTVSDVQAGHLFSAAWLVRKGFRPLPKLFKLVLPSPLDRLANLLTPTKRTWNGHNSSCFREDAIAVNGFNELIQYGGQDVEFGCRLNHAGIRGRHLRFSTIPVHLYHGHGYVKPGMRERSAAQRLETNQQRLVRVEVGLDQWLRSDGSVRLTPEDHFRDLAGNKP
ncbi:glycosyltransferase [Cyanobium sp. ATX 6E8]|uniref:glycosyltransferase n=1 Tax=Cyanobium sp. ATX 6E8 TaxID=2823701 RepID=UPI0020CD75C7|nr:glycosyltransferase [Cyanobium sp. ATX 6E8]MCP9943157.1 glycosyltransferase [Cyanobium sp. ATX 6E8]